MARLLALTLLAALLVVALPAGTASAAVKRCGQVNVDLEPEGEGSAVRIRATNVSCRRARRIARDCVEGEREEGWRFRFRRGRVILTRGERRVSYAPAGGGGCGPVG